MVVVADHGAAVAAEQGGDPGGRGRLQISDRALGRLARAVALDVPGVVRQGRGPHVLSGVISGYPGVQVEQSGGRVRFGLDLAVLWDAPVQEVAEQVRGQVRSRVAELSGCPVDRADVMVAALVPRVEQSVARVQ